MKNLIPALIRAKRNFKPLAKDSYNPFFKSKYISLDAILDAVEEALSNEGLVLISTVEGIVLKTSLWHESGEVIESCHNLPEVFVNHAAALDFAKLQAEFSVQSAQYKQGAGMKVDFPNNLNPMDPQKFGSAVSYARRYTISAVLQLSVDIDDDGNEASGKSPQKTNNYQNKPSTKNGINQNQRVKDICNVLGYPQDNARQWLQSQKVNSFGDLPAQQVDDFLNTIWQMWAGQRGIKVNALPAGCNVALVRNWCEQAAPPTTKKPQPASNPRDIEASKIFKLLEYPEAQAKGWLKKTHDLEKFSELSEIDYLSFVQAVANSWSYTQSMAGGSSLETLDIPDTPPSAKYEDVEKWHGQIIDGLFNKHKKAKLKVLKSDQPA